MIKLTATRSMKYGSRRLVPGDVFDARDKDARILTLLGSAVVYVEPPRPKRKKAEEVVQQASELDLGEYRRRDMRVEE